MRVLIKTVVLPLLTVMFGVGAHAQGMEMTVTSGGAIQRANDQGDALLNAALNDVLNKMAKMAQGCPSGHFLAGYTPALDPICNKVNAQIITNMNKLAIEETPVNIALPQTVGCTNLHQETGSCTLKVKIDNYLGDDKNKKLSDVNIAFGYGGGNPIPGLGGKITTQGNNGNFEIPNLGQDFSGSGTTGGRKGKNWTANYNAATREITFVGGSYGWGGCHYTGCGGGVGNIKVSFTKLALVVPPEETIVQPVVQKTIEKPALGNPVNQVPLLPVELDEKEPKGLMPGQKPAVKQPTVVQQPVVQKPVEQTPVTKPAEPVADRPLPRNFKAHEKINKDFKEAD